MIKGNATLEDVMEFDRAFFEANPDCEAFTREIELCELLPSHKITMLNTHFVMVSIVGEGARVRTFIKRSTAKRKKGKGFGA